MDHGQPGITRLSGILEDLIERGSKNIAAIEEFKLAGKPSPNKWSKKEILGHLIDSAINNLQRFTEIQYLEKPYTVKKYNQDELVLANSYQTADVRELLSLWIALNRRIVSIIRLQTPETLNHAIILNGDRQHTLDFLIRDYISHLEHHLQQIID